MEEQNKINAKAKTSQIMRWTAAVLYALLCVYQMFSLRFTLITIPNTSISVASLTVTWAFELCLMVLVGIMAVWMFSGKEPLSANVRRSIAMATVLVVIFELMSYTTQTETFNLVLYFTFDITDNKIWPFVMMLARLFLYILAAFFVSSASVAADEKKAKAEQETDETKADDETTEADDKDADTTPKAESEKTEEK